MLEEVEEGSIVTEEIEKPLEENKVGPTSIDVTDEPVSIGPTSIDVTDEQASIVETPLAEQQEKEEVQEQNMKIEQAQEESKISKRKQKKRITSYLSNVSNQVEKQGNQINRLTIIIQSLQKQKQKKPTINTRIDRSQSLSIKQIKSQINQLQRQISGIQADVVKIRINTVTESRQGTSTRVRKRAPSSSIKPRSKKTKSYRSIQSGKQRRIARKRLKSKP
jgi:hypothetical protein